MSTSYAAELEQAVELQKQIDALIEQQDRILTPVAQQMMERIRVAAIEDKSKLIAEVRLWPRGFYQAEVLTAINERFGAGRWL